jgi:hypothetical protein
MCGVARCMSSGHTHHYCKIVSLACRGCLQGIAGQGFYSDMVVPIIENTARECELTGRLREAIVAYPEANAVLVRR